MNMMQKKPFHVIIPARYQSTRFPAKLLMDLHGQSVLERVYRQALKASPLSITIATDHVAIYEVAQAFGADVIMTSVTHATGTDRLAEAVKILDIHPDDCVVNVQGDEPFIHPELIQQVANALSHTTTSVATLCWPITDVEMLMNPHVVKVVRNQNHDALYFSRSPIPAHRDGYQSLKHVFRHIGLYAYRAGFLCDFVEQPACELEMLEGLEQLRVLWLGHRVRVENACMEPRQDINIPEDLARACAQLSTQYA